MAAAKPQNLFSQTGSLDVLADVRAKLLLRVAQGGLLLHLLMIAGLFFRSAGAVDFSLYVCTGSVLLVVLFFAHHAPRLAGGVVICGFLIAVTWASWNREGLGSGTTSGAFALAIVFAGLLWSPQGAYVVAVMSSGAIAVLAWLAPHVPLNPMRSWTETTAILFTIAVFVHQSLRLVALNVVAAQKSESRFRHLVTSSPHGVVWLNETGDIQLMNPAAEKLMGIAFETAKDQALAELSWLAPRDTVLLRQSLGRLQQEEMDAEYEVVTLEGDQHLELRLAGLKAGCSGAGGLLTITDISERIEAERIQAQFREREERSSKLEALGRLAGGVAHDFNNVLTVIWAMSDLLREPAIDPSRVASHAREISAAAERAAELTRQLLAFGRKQVLAPQISNANTVLEEVYPMLQRLLPETIAVRLECVPDLGNVRVDVGRLEQVIMNLATNAAESMPNGGVVTLSTANTSLTLKQCADNPEAKPGPFVELAVQDEGCGMSPYTLKQVFEPFFSEGKKQGVGLGLSTTHGIVLQSNGVIAVDSVEGQGTKVRVYLPRVELSVRSPKATVESTETRAPRLSVLVVEDYQEVRQAVATMLRSDGHRVDTSSNGVSALESYDDKLGEYDLLVTDLVMPQMPGSELAHKMKERSPQLRVLFVSGYADDPSFQQGDWKTVGEFLSKPFDRDMLADKLASMFETERG